MKTWREQAEQAGAVIAVDGNRVSVHLPSHKVIVRDVVEMGSVEDTVEACCKTLVKHIEKVSE